MFIKPDYNIGVGLNYRNEIADELIKNIHRIDFLEINTERFFNNNINERLNKIIDKIPIVLHGLTLSLGSSSPDISQSYIDNLTNTLLKVDCQWFSEHIAITNVKDIEIRGLMPVELTEESIENIANKVKQVMSLSNKPFLLENITYYYSMPNSKINEIDFINRVIELSDCGLLLDLNNLYVNSINHSYDPYDFINKLPLDRIIEVHLAGCDYIYGMLVDTHASNVKDSVLSLLKYLCQKTKINGVVIERDDKLTNFQELLDEVALVKNIINNGI